MKRGQAGVCVGSGSRYPISVADECARQTRCRFCGRVLRVRPTRPKYPVIWRGDVPGTPMATLPMHKETA